MSLANYERLLDRAAPGLLLALGLTASLAVAALWA